MNKDVHNHHSPWSSANPCRPRNLLRLAGIGALTVGLTLAGCAYNTETAGKQSTELTDVADVIRLFDGIPQQGNTLGESAAPVTLIEVSDLQCSHCRTFATQALPKLVERYVRPGKVRLVFQHFPILGEDSRRAARAAIAAGAQNRMWSFIDLFFHNQGRARSGYVTDAFLASIASQVPGIDVARLMKERDTQDVSDRLADDTAAAQGHRILGVPSFLIGRAGGAPHMLHVRRTADPDAFTRPIDELLATP